MVIFTLAAELRDINGIYLSIQVRDTEHEIVVKEMSLQILSRKHRNVILATRVGLGRSAD